MKGVSGQVRSGTSGAGSCPLGQVQSRIRRTTPVTARLVHPNSPAATVTSAPATATSARADPARHPGQERGQRRFRTPHFLHLAMPGLSSKFAV